MSLGCKALGGCEWPWGGPIFRFWGTQADFQHDGANLYSHQQCTKAPFLHIHASVAGFISLLVVILTGRRWNLEVVLICDPLMTKNMELIFSVSQSLVFLLWEISVQLHSLFLNLGQFYFRVWLFVFLTYSRYWYWYWSSIRYIWKNIPSMGCHSFCGLPLLFSFMSSTCQKLVFFPVLLECCFQVLTYASVLKSIPPFSSSGLGGIVSCIEVSDMFRIEFWVTEHIMFQFHFFFFWHVDIQVFLTPFVEDTDFSQVHIFGDHCQK